MMSQSMRTPQIVIVGAGFAGLLSAKRLSMRLGKSAKVVLLNTSDEFLFAPRLVDVLQERFERLPFRSDLAKLASRYGFRFLKATVTGIDRTEQKITYIANDGAVDEMSYDVVVVCPGATTCYYNTPGAKEFAIDLKTFESILQIRTRIVATFKRATAATNDAERRRLLSFSVVGAGASGVEAIFALKLHTEKYAATHAPELKKFLSFVLVQAAPQVLVGFPDAMVDGAIAQLHRQGISLFLNEPVTRVLSDGFETMHGRQVPSGLVLWCAGLSPQPLSITPEPMKDPAGFIQTDRNLQVDERMFAAGDAITFRDNHVVVPKNGQTARRMAFTITDNVIRVLQKRPLKHFHYFSKGTLLIVGKMGYLDLGGIILKSRLVLPLRDILYRMLYNEIAK